MSREIEPAAAEGAPAPASAGVVRLALAALVFAIGFATLFHAMLGVSWRESVPVNVARGADAQRAYQKGIFEETDHRFVVWQTARNAYTLLSSPARLFQAEPCHPAADVLALGEPGITLGLLGIPAMLLSGDPIVSYNVVLALVVAISFAAMLLLVREWTDSFSAGLVAALLYAFHEIKIKDPVHFYAWDNSWTVLALFFATRLFTRARWVDAIGLSAAIAMQLSGSLYPVMTAVFFAPPLMIWLAIRYGVRDLRPAQWLFVIACTALVAVPVFSPYLELSRAGVLTERGYKVFLAFGWLLPDGPAFPGWAQLGLLLAAFTLPRRFVVGRQGGDPRIALLVIAILLVSVAAGGNTAARLEAMQRGEPLPLALPNLYDALAALLPGLAQVRGPAALYGGVHLALCVLAGFGAVGLLRLAGARARPYVAVGLLALVYLELMRPAFLARPLGLDPRIDYVSFTMRPPAEELEFFERIARDGRDGPLLELPFNPLNIDQSSHAILLSAYHRRRTQQCFNSFQPPEVQSVKQISDRLPATDAIRELAALGFTTILIHSDPEPGEKTLRRAWRREFEAVRQGAPLRLVAESELLVAYDIEIAPGAAFLLPEAE